MSNPSRDEIARQLERILAHELFQTSERLSAFLRFVVETDLAGRASELKEYVVGVEVFGRPESYNPQVEPIVRITAKRLRGRLAEYYQDAGRRDPVVIRLPKGGYVPQYLAPTPPEPTANDHERLVGAVGRDGELDRLRAAFASVSRGSGAMVNVSGDAGIGKTTVVEEFLAGIDPREAWIARGRGSERLAQSDAFVPVLEALDTLARDESREHVVESMRTVAPTWVLEAHDKSASHERMRREFVALFESLSRERPVVLFLDDMHWADASTCDLLAYLGSRIGRVRMLIVTACRPAATAVRNHPFLSVKLDFERRGLWHELPINLLAPADIDRYIALQFPLNHFPSEFAQLVYERTEGSPLFMVDMLRYLRDRGVVAQDGGGWRLAQPTEEVRKTIPSGVRSMIQLELGQLGEVDRRILRCAAIQGVEFDSAVAARVLALDAVDVEERLQDLEAVNRIVRMVGEREFPDRTVSVRYRFVHVLYQNALYETPAPSRRAALCHAVAEALVQLSGDGARAIASELALLYESARDLENASRHFLQAARNAARVFAYPEAATLGKRGLAALGALPDSPERDTRELTLSLTVAMAVMATHGYSAPEVERLHGRARELGLKLNDVRRLFPALVGLHTVHVTRGNLVQALGVGRELERVAKASADPAILVESLHATGTVLAFMGRCAEAREALGRIASTYSPGQGVFHGSMYLLDRHVTSLSMYARLLAYMGFLDQALQRAREAAKLAEKLAHPQTQAYAAMWIGYVHHTRGEPGQALTFLEPAMELAADHGLPQIEEWARVVRGSALVETGQREEGIARMRESIRRQDAIGSLIERAYCLTLLAEAVGGEEALELCQAAFDFGKRTDGRCYEPDTHRVRGMALLGLGKVEEAEAEFKAAIDTARISGSLLLELRAAVAHHALRQRSTALADVADRFTEGRDAPVVSSAVAMLGQRTRRAAAK